jgi:hypothetical protein
MAGFLRTNDNPDCGICFALKCVGERGNGCRYSPAFIDFHDTVYGAKEAFPACGNRFAKAFWTKFLNGGDGVVGREEKNGLGARHGVTIAARAVRAARIDMRCADKAAIF